MFQHLSRLQTDRRFFDPATEAVRLSFTADEDGFATLAVFAHGTGHALSLGEFRIRAGANRVTWHGRDNDGIMLPAGGYDLVVYGVNAAGGASGEPPLRAQVALVRRPGAAATAPTPAPPAGAAARGCGRGLSSLFRR